MKYENLLEPINPYVVQNPEEARKRQTNARFTRGDELLCRNLRLPAPHQVVFQPKLVTDNSGRQRREPLLTVSLPVIVRLRSWFSLDLDRRFRSDFFFHFYSYFRVRWNEPVLKDSYVGVPRGNIIVEI